MQIYKKQNIAIKKRCVVFYFTKHVKKVGDTQIKVRASENIFETRKICFQTRSFFLRQAFLETKRCIWSL